MNKKVFASLLIVFSLCNSAYCWVTGNDLVNFWKDYQTQSGTYTTGMYMGYIAGCLDSNNMINYAMREWKLGAGNLGIELPANATLGQLCSVVGKWLDNNPEKWNLEANLLIIMALREAFPAK